MRFECEYEIVTAKGECLLRTDDWQKAMDAVEATWGRQLRACTEDSSEIAVAVRPTFWLEHPGPLSGDAILIYYDEPGGRLVCTVDLLWTCGPGLYPTSAHVDSDGCPIWGVGEPEGEEE